MSLRSGFQGDSGVLARAAAASLATLAPLASVAESNLPPSRPPNIVLVVVDDMGFADVGFMGSRDVRTPHIDALAASGMVCATAYVTAPICSPSRAGFLTGRYQTRFGHERNPSPTDANAGLPLSERTFAEYLREQGYATGGIGKWHLGKSPRFHPNHRGFDHWYGFAGGGHFYLNWSVDDTKEYLSPIQRNQEAVEVPQGAYLTDVLSDEAVTFVQRHRDEPFFLYLSYNAPHTPMQAPDRLLQSFASIGNPLRRQYAAMMSAVDDGVGRLEQSLHEAGIRDNTLIVFFSDNGGSMNGSSNDPLRGGKSSLYEGGIRTPLVISWPGRLPAGQTFEQPVSTLDLLPTALAAAGGTSAHDDLEGVNLLPYLLGQRTTAPHDKLHWRTRDGRTWAIRQGNMKLLQPDTNKPLELYNLEEDPAETTNLADQLPQTVTALQAAHTRWNADNIAPAFQGLMSGARAE